MTMFRKELWYALCLHLVLLVEDVKEVQLVLVNRECIEGGGHISTKMD